MEEIIPPSHNYGTCMPNFRDTILEPFGSQIQDPVAPSRKPTLNRRNKLPLSSLAIISDMCS
ncbi:hypothetical protein V8C34DRAFT_296650 [Trichoderma compactum]